ncbi:hypothetical protein [Corynebacterium doosanense]|uniref:hypothetical protein n=1 Tax=Corynebacterium doosanense TaxID=1121358 RepID=UPI000368C3E9|nr:hypothetical protein [Corynebacterium doosanense]
MADQFNDLFEGISGIFEAQFGLAKAIIETIGTGLDLGSSAIEGSSTEAPEAAETAK